MKPPVTLSKSQPIYVLGVCKAAALKADWRLREWDEFKRTADACLSPKCEAEEMKMFLKVVEERFEVTRSPTFVEWSPEEAK